MQANNKDLSPHIVSESGMLHTAIWRGDYENFLHLVQTSDLSVTDVLGRGPLHLAAERGHPRMIEVLSLNVDLNLQCSNGQTALHSAAWGGSASVVAKLLQAGADSGIKDKNGNLALHIAAQVGNLEIIKFLLTLKDDLNIKGHNDLTLLHFATMHGHEEMVKFLEGADLEARDNKFGWTPLHCAVDYGNCDTVRLLIQRGADINAVDDLTWWTPLHIAMMNGDIAITRFLVENGAAAASDKHGWMPHHFAEANSHMELLKLVSERNSNISSVNNLSWTPLHCRAINNQPGISKLLVGEGAEIYAQPMAVDWDKLQFAAKQSFRDTIKWIIHSGDSEYCRDLNKLLVDAAENGHETLVRVIINEGVDIRTNPWSDWTIQAASAQGHEATVRLLIEAGADVNPPQPFHDGKTSLQLAAQGGHNAVVELLLQAGASRDAKSRCGMTPIHLATLMGHEECVLSLLHASADARILGVLPSGEELELMLPGGSDSVFHENQKLDDQLKKGELSEDENKNEELESDAVYDTEDTEFRHHESADEELVKETPLETAIRYGRDAIAKMLIEALPSIDSSIGRYFTALHMAVDLGSVSIIKLLLEAGANLTVGNEKTNHGEQAIHIAAVSGNTEIIQLLLNAGADIMARDDKGRTPLHHVAQKARGRNGDVIPFLIAAGAERDARDRKGKTPFHLACKTNKRAVQSLLNAGADIEMEDDVGRRPLHFVRSADTTRLLVDAGAKLDVKSQRDEIPLFMAVKSRPACTEILLDAGADLESREGKKGQTPLIHAAFLGRNLRCMEILLERGANLKAKDNMGHDAFFYAREWAQRDPEFEGMVELLRKAGGRTRHVRRLFKGFRIRKSSENPEHDRDDFQEEFD